MLKKLGFTLLFASSMWSTPALAETQVPNQGISIEVKFPPNDPQTYTNAAFWTINATCKITTTDASDIFFVQMLRKKGKINGTSVSDGDTLNFPVHTGDKLSITAESGAQVRLTNTGSHTVIANCSA